MPLPERIAKRLRLPLIAAPMLRVSGPELVMAACRNGVIGAFPTSNARSTEELGTWLDSIQSGLSPEAAPWCPNLIMRSPRLKGDLEMVLSRRAEVVIASVGSPAPIIPALHEAGCLVFADIATLHHARRAIEAGADGLVLLTAGAGGQTGWLNPFAFVRAVRATFDGPIVLAGGISDGCALRAATVLGCDLGYMGTKFIATAESMASDAYKAMLVASSADDVMLTKAITGLETNMLRPSIVASGLDPANLNEEITEAHAREKFAGAAPEVARRWTDIWSAGHSVSGVRRVMSVQDLVEVTAREFCADPA